MAKKKKQSVYEKLLEAINAPHNNPTPPPPMPSGTHPFHPAYGYPGISPTDNDARGMYEYQEPEVDEQGTYYGYKILHKHCPRPDCDVLLSPRYPREWKGGELTADVEPSAHSMFGIHCTKRMGHPELKQYCGIGHSRYYYHSYTVDRYSEHGVLVKCALSGTIVETEQGFRAQHAQIIGVYFDGHWQSYQDYQERTAAYSRSVADPWREDIERRGRWVRGDWKINSSIDPDP